MQVLGLVFGACLKEGFRVAVTRGRMIAASSAFSKWDYIQVPASVSSYILENAFFSSCTLLHLELLPGILPGQGLP